MTIEELDDWKYESLAKLDKMHERKLTPSDALKFGCGSDQLDYLQEIQDQAYSEARRSIELGRTPLGWRY